MRICADARAGELAAALDALSPLPDASDFRTPESGLVMLRGRMGGDGRAFNFGEATVTRAAVRIDTGEVGHAYQLGRDRAKARVAAILDALVQSGKANEVVAALAPASRRIAEERALVRRQTAATRVDFFTMTRGED
ncbi:phosphonate C-P lyase system protein PhnG [Hansschlegelia quercus]|uniref:Phosphonate C-P lyase system protein PhnG n=2 Tax=Hansschlegelia quercus TaxID=2528245 RepID=A0A4Q9GG79_9HYPH|nr:phosphonate C-P lyase system protein PhnG [Hansschlegelia quercus]